nr:hypothetical protein CFP56_56715 [Quercus suber]
MGSLDVDRRHVAVEHGGEVEWVRSRRCWGATSEPICFFQTPSFTFPRSSGTTKNAVVFGDSDLQVTKPSSDLGLIVFPILLPELKHWKCRFYRKGIRFKSGRFGMIIWKKSFL